MQFAIIDLLAVTACGDKDPTDTDAGDTDTRGAPADVVEADWGTLAEGLDWSCKAAEHPEAEHQWQLATFARLLAVQPRHPPDSDAPHKDGSPIRRDWFFQ